MVLIIWWTSAHWRLRSVREFGAPLQISTGFASWQRYCTASSSGRQLNFAALNRGRHLCSAGRPSRWALAHILVNVCLSRQNSADFTRNFQSKTNYNIADSCPSILQIIIFMSVHKEQHNNNKNSIILIRTTTRHNQLLAAKKLSIKFHLKAYVLPS